MPSTEHVDDRQDPGPVPEHEPAEAVASPVERLAALRRRAERAVTTSVTEPLAGVAELRSVVDELMVMLRREGLGRP